MKIIMWNIRGMGRTARRRQLKEMIIKEKPDIIGGARNYQEGVQRERA